jgi:predicted nuclease with TOPRIM domain
MNSNKTERLTDKAICANHILDKIKRLESENAILKDGLKKMSGELAHKPLITPATAGNNINER